MNKPDEQTFVPDRWVVRLSHFGICFFGALAVLSIGLAIFKIVVTPEKKGALIVYLLSAFGSYRKQPLSL